MGISRKMGKVKEWSGEVRVMIKYMGISKEDTNLMKKIIIYNNFPDLRYQADYQSFIKKPDPGL
jgi:hypothetical protein